MARREVSDPLPALTARLALELERVTRLIHDRAATQSQRLGLLPSGPIFGVLVELRTPLLAGGLDVRSAAAIYRYRPDATELWRAAAAGGWLEAVSGRMQATPRTTDLLRRLMHLHDEVTSSLWGAPDGLLRDATRAVVETDYAGRAFRAWRAPGQDAATTVAGRAFLVLTTLRYLRADVHADAWAAAGYDAQSVQTLRMDHPQRRAIEADTNRRNADALRASGSVTIASVVGGTEQL